MESHEKELILNLKETDVKLSRLYSQHEKFETELSKYVNKPFLTTIEEVQVKSLKTKKLKGVDKMMQIVKQYKRAA